MTLPYHWLYENCYYSQSSAMFPRDPVMEYKCSSPHSTNHCQKYEIISAQLICKSTFYSFLIPATSYLLFVSSLVLQPGWDIDYISNIISHRKHSKALVTYMWCIIFVHYGMLSKRCSWLTVLSYVLICKPQQNMQVCSISCHDNWDQFELEPPQWHQKELQQSHC